MTPLSPVPTSNRPCLSETIDQMYFAGIENSFGCPRVDFVKPVWEAPT
jgi:hypothetical protein